MLEHTSSLNITVPNNSIYVNTARCVIEHLNVQSMYSNLNTQSNIIEYLQHGMRENRKVDIFMISETWIKRHSYLKYWIKNSAISDHYTIISDNPLTNNEAGIEFRGKGTAIVVSKEWAPFIQTIYRFHGRATVLKLVRLQEIIIIGCVYMPSGSSNRKETKRVYQFIRKLIRKTPNNSKVILLGDWNGVVNPSLDRQISYNPGGTEVSSETSPERPFLTKLLKKHTHKSLCDIWRVFNPTVKEYTHTVYTEKLYPSKARLDFALVSENLVIKTNRVWI